MKAKRTPFNDFSPESGRRQCVSIAKMTGKRCGCAAIPGADRCRVHKGISPAIRNLRRDSDRPIHRATNDLVARMTLCAVGYGPEPEGLESVLDGVHGSLRGRLIEAYQNRALCPGEYKEILLKCQNKKG
jgi:hypothetical protein